jgi:hypothetical protein
MPITNLDKYKTTWQNWWRGLQPEWRLLDDGTFLQEAQDMGEQWVNLRQGGPNGFFLIVLALGWWVKGTDGKGDLGLHKLLDDITWVMGRMTDMPTPDQSIGGKHAQEDKLHSSIKKRYTLSFPITSQTNGANITA